MNNNNNNDNNSKADHYGAKFSVPDSLQPSANQQSLAKSICKLILPTSVIVTYCYYSAKS